MAYLDDPGAGGTAERCRAAFLDEHTLPAWAAAIEAAIQGARDLPGTASTSLLVVGHFEGGIVAAHVDARFGEDDPLLFDAGYLPKPAYFGARAALAGRQKGL